MSKPRVLESEGILRIRQATPDTIVLEVWSNEFGEIIASERLHEVLQAAKVEPLSVLRELTDSFYLSGNEIYNEARASTKEDRHTRCNRYR